MADAWGGSWGTSWGVSWNPGGVGPPTPPVVIGGGGDRGIDLLGELREEARREELPKLPPTAIFRLRTRQAKQQSRLTFEELLFAFWTEQRQTIVLEVTAGRIQTKAIPVGVQFETFRIRIGSAGGGNEVRIVIDTE